jgi:putative nucleotidyltransferase with HDIG domain
MSNFGLNREEAIVLLNEFVKNEKMIQHCLASEVVLKALAEKFGENSEMWSLAGLLHDIDVEITNADLKIHGLEAEKILTNKGVDKEIIDAIKRHNEAAHDLKRETKFHFALAAGETITGIITATALVYPDKKLENVKVKSITKRMKEKAFAASVNRDIIMECEKINLSIDEFAEISLKAMQSIHENLGL